MSDSFEQPPNNRGNAGKGRPKGSPDKVTRPARDVIAEAAERLGGDAGLAEWARESADNQKLFWTQLFIKTLSVKPADDAETGTPLAATWLPPE